MSQANWPVYAGAMLIAGVGIPIQAALNGSLGGKLGNPFVAAMIATALAFSIATATVMVNGAPRGLPFGDAPFFWYLGGAFMALYIIAITFVGPRFGVGNAIFFVLLGQIISAAAIDHFGLFGAARSPVTAMRLAGIALMGLGVFLARKPMATEAAATLVR